jgi:hypothetical protein
MKWLIWSPAIVLILSAFAVPGGIALFAVPLLALGYVLFTLVALSGSKEHHAARGTTAGREQHEPASHVAAERSSATPPRPLVTTAGRRTA